MQRIKRFFDRADYLVFRLFVLIGMLMLLWRVVA